MRCNDCGADTKDLRAHVHIAALRRPATPQPVHLCAACRVVNALSPRYVALPPPAPVERSAGRRGPRVAPL